MSTDTDTTGDAALVHVIIRALEQRVKDLTNQLNDEIQRYSPNRTWEHHIIIGRRDEALDQLANIRILAGEEEGKG